MSSLLAKISNVFLSPLQHPIWLKGVPCNTRSFTNHTVPPLKLYASLVETEREIVLKVTLRYSSGAVPLVAIPSSGSRSSCSSTYFRATVRQGPNCGSPSKTATALSSSSGGNLSLSFSRSQMGSVTPHSTENPPGVAVGKGVRVGVSVTAIVGVATTVGCLPNGQSHFGISHFHGGFMSAPLRYR